MQAPATVEPVGGVKARVDFANGKPRDQSDIRCFCVVFDRVGGMLVGATQAIYYQAELSVLGKLQENLENVGVFQIAGRHAQDRGRLAIIGMQPKQILSISCAH